MSFEIVECNSLGLIRALPPGQASIDRHGCARVHAADLAKLKVTTEVTVLADLETQRIALRRPRGGEKAFKVAVVTAKKKRPTDRRRINLAPALAELRIDQADVSGRYTLHAKDDLLVINLEEAGPDEADETES